MNSVPPEDDPPVLADDPQVLASLLDIVQIGFREQFAPGTRRLPGRPESWGFIPAETAVVLAQLRLARRASPARRPRFLDCGSGFGFVAGLAHQLDFVVTGVEIEPSYIEVSRRVFSFVPVVEADLLSYDDYGSFDVVYYFGPFADSALAARFERRVEDALRPGGIVCANHKVSQDWKDGPFDILHADGEGRFVLQKRAR